MLDKRRDGVKSLQADREFKFCKIGLNKIKYLGEQKCLKMLFSVSLFILDFAITPSSIKKLALANMRQSLLGGGKWLKEKPNLQ